MARSRVGSISAPMVHKIREFLRLFSPEVGFILLKPKPCDVGNLMLTYKLYNVASSMIEANFYRR